MEGRKQTGSGSGSSFASDLFGAKDSPAAADSSFSSSSSSGAFRSIFAREPQPRPRPQPLQLSGADMKNASVTGGISNCINHPGSSTSDNFNPYYQLEQKVQQQQPFQWSSSIYYGGQEVYSQPQNAAANNNPAPLTTIYVLA
ncbi:uncharacterized protein LOC127239864 isoform X2 [Andrographis paniculata]|uniref:uncharacterized protein LOC127239864 isoform X2 n=1 Tax=Andrographis paniculata TaxID=175694 RepID=UPI0021E8DDF1|nr:uncharacterized protein LOC127239864 isoform X2 [Andrographis paniculata]